MLRSRCLSLLLALSGCADGDFSPGSLPAGAISGVYTTADAQGVASCISTALGNSVQVLGDRLIIPSVRNPGVSYSVGPNLGGSQSYSTQIAITGVEKDAKEARAVNMCITASAKKW